MLKRFSTTFQQKWQILTILHFQNFPQKLKNRNRSHGLNQNIYGMSGNPALTFHRAPFFFLLIQETTMMLIPDGNHKSAKVEVFFIFPHLASVFDHDSHIPVEFLQSCGCWETENRLEIPLGQTQPKTASEAKVRERMQSSIEVWI